MAASPVTVEVDLRRAKLRLDSMPDKVRSELLSTVEMLDVALLATASALAPERTGKLKAHIRGSVSSSKRRITGRVRARTKYAAIINYGGHIPGHEILPDTMQALAFYWRGRQVFAGRIYDPGATLKGEFFMQHALSSMRGEIVTDMQEAVKRGVAE
jgi:hypothetical protein